MSLKIGVDGGGTKTECILVDESGTVLARRLAPGCNPNIVGREEAARIVKEALADLVSDFRFPLSAFALLCMAGSRTFWREFAASLSGFGRVAATDDSVPVLELATAGGAGLVLHSGTGSFVAARAGAEAIEGVRYAGGLGYRFGDPGSGYDIGRRAVARALLEMQGWNEPSGLRGLVQTVTGQTTVDANLAYFYGDPAPNSKIAALTPAVLRLAGEGDAAAQSLVIDSASGLLDLAIRVAAKVFPNAPRESLRAGLSGSILTHPAVAKALSARSPFPLIRVEAPPIEGVRRILQKYEG